MSWESTLAFLSLDTLHRLFFFLGTTEGFLFKATLELVIFTLLAYMVVSEYIQSKQQEMRFLIIALFTIMLHRIFFVAVYANTVFRGQPLTIFNSWLPLFMSLLELIALILFINAFLFQFFKIQFNKESMWKEFTLVLATTLIVGFFWLQEYASNPSANFTLFWGELAFLLISIGLVLFALYTIVHGPFTKYRIRLFAAFFLYLIAPTLHIINQFIFGDQNLRLKLLEQPFPFLAICLFYEITYRKLVDKAYLREQLAESEKKYQQEKELGKLKDEFISVVSHELKTPITSMKLYLSLLKKKKFGKLTRKQEDALHIIEDESDRLAHLIHDTLDLSRLEAGKGTLHTEAFDLHDLGNPLYYQVAGEKGIKIVFRIHPGFVVHVDKRKFMQVFMNLLSNAIKFTEKKGTITIRAEKNDREWKLHVEDTGKGIPEQELPKLFSKFYQVDSPMTRQHSGFGLGLAIVKEIVSLHGGSVEVQSTEGKGSTFTVVMPDNISQSNLFKQSPNS